MGSLGHNSSVLDVCFSGSAVGERCEAQLHAITVIDLRSTPIPLQMSTQAQSGFVAMTGKGISGQASWKKHWRVYER